MRRALGECSRVRHAAATRRPEARGGAVLRRLLGLVLLACLAAVPFPAFAQGGGGGSTEAVSIACNGQPRELKLCKPGGRFCDGNATILAAPPVGVGHAGGHDITFTGIPAGGATISYVMSSPRLGDIGGTAQKNPATGVFTNPAQTFSIATGATETYTFTASGPGSYTQQVVIDRQPPGTATYNYVSYSAACTPRPTSGRITAVKSSLGGTGTFPVTLTRGATVTTVNVTTSGAPDGTGSQVRDLPAGTYTVGEAATAGWTLNDISCVKTRGTGSASGRTVTLAAGDEVTCTITNTKDVAGLNLKKSSRRASFNAAGQALVFDLTISNAGTSTLTGISVSDPGTVVSGCSAASLPPGGTIQCTATRTTTQADLNAGLYRNTATASATDPVQGAVSAKAVVSVPAKTRGSIAISASASPGTYADIGDRVTYEFEVTNTSAKELTSVTLEGVEISLSACRPAALPGTLAPGASTLCSKEIVITTADIGGKCLSVAATASALSGADPVTASASAKACLTPDKTNRTIARFVSRRADRLAAHEPDAPRRFWRLEDAGKSADSGGDAVAVTGSGDDRTMTARVATSLEQVRRAGLARHPGEAGGTSPGGDPMGLGALSKPPVSAPMGIDLWTEAHFERWKSDEEGAKSAGDFGVAFLGADTALSPSILVGALVQLDWMSDHSETESTDVTGTGWLAGPYVAIKLTENLYLDARAAWGTSSNKISPFGTYTDTFDTTRWLARANLTGSWSFGDLRLSPHAGLVWVEESQDGYTDTNGLEIAAHAARVGRLTFGPEISYAFKSPDGSVWEPHAGLTAQWDFERSNEGALAGEAPGADDLRLKAEAGLTVRGATGASLRAVATYDGIGAKSFEALGGEVWINVPLEALGEEFFPALDPGRMSLGAEPMVVAQAAEADTDAVSQSGAAGAGESEAEASYELPAVIVESPVEPAASSKPKKKRKAKSAPQPQAEEPAKTAKVKKPKPAEATSQGGGDGGVSGAPQEAAPADSLTGETDSEVVAAGAAGDGSSGISAGARSSRAVEQATTVAEVTAADIQRRGARTLDEAVALVPGIHTRNGPDGVPRLDIRGLRTRNVLLLLDGVPLNSTFDGQFDPRSIPVGNISKIKVTKGASSVLYGPGGNAAVIDIVTKGAAAGKHGSAEAQWSPERGHDERLTASYGSKKLKVFLSATNLDQQSFTLSDDYQPTRLQGAGERLNSDREDQTLYANMSWQPAAAATFGLSVNWRTGEYGKPPATVAQSESIFAQRTRFERVDDYEALSLQSSSLIKLTDAFSIRPTAYYNELYELTNNFDGPAFSTQTGANALREDAETSIGGGGLQAAWKMGEHLLTVSADAHVESWHSKGFQVPCLVNSAVRGGCDLAGEAQTFDADHTIEVLSAAAEQELKLAPGLTAVAGAGVTEQIRSGIKDQDYTWLLGSRYELGETTAVRAAIARKVRHPTLRDLYDIQGGNPDLETEVTRNTEIALEQQIPALKTALTIALFRTEAENFIERQQGISSNIAALLFQGIETEARIGLMPGLDVTIGYTWLEAFNETPGAVDKTLQYRPEHKATLSAAYRFDWGLRLSADYLLVAGSTALPSGGGDGTGGGSTLGSTEHYELDPSHVVNLGFAQEIQGTRAEVFGRIDNVTDENAYQAFGIPEPGRTYFGGLRAKF